MGEIYYVKPIDNSRLVPVADPGEPRRHFSTILLVSLGFAAVMFSAWLRLDGVQTGYRLESLQQQVQQLAEANRKLRLEEAALGDPLRVETIARNQLGMTNLSPRQIVGGEPEAPPVSVVAQTRPPLPPETRQVAAAVP